MPSLADVVRVLNAYAGRYERLDAFVDDIDEFRWQFIPGTRMIASAPNPVLETSIEGQGLRIEVFRDRGVASFRLLGSTPKPTGEAVGAGAALGGALGAALGAASETKEGLLGGLVLGVLVGGLLGAAASPVERALALQFDPVSASWRLYDGPLLSWAKKTLIPTT